MLWPRTSDSGRPPSSDIRPAGTRRWSCEHAGKTGNATHMTDSHRPLAGVTGASGGIGLALAREFAKHGFELVIAADGEAIHDVALELDAEAVQADLATPDGVRALHTRLRHQHVTALALNAGITARSDDLDRELQLVDLNCRSLVHLA